MTAEAIAGEQEPAPFAINLDAARAQRAEAEGTRHTVQLGGELFMFPGVSEWPVQITRALADGDLVEAVMYLLFSPEDQERFMRHRPTMGDLNELFDALGKASGIGGLGNSRSSGRSSRTTRKR